MESFLYAENTIISATVLRFYYSYAHFAAEATETRRLNNVPNVSELT